LQLARMAAGAIGHRDTTTAACAVVNGRCPQPLGHAAAASTWPCPLVHMMLQTALLGLFCAVGLAGTDVPFRKVSSLK
jgi:hypothetical protein